MWSGERKQWQQLFLLQRFYKGFKRFHSEPIYPASGRPGAQSMPQLREKTVLWCGVPTGLLEREILHVLGYQTALAPSFLEFEGALLSSPALGLLHCARSSSAYLSGTIVPIPVSPQTPPSRPSQGETGHTFSQLLLQSAFSHSLLLSLKGH